MNFFKKGLFQSLVPCRKHKPKPKVKQKPYRPHGQVGREGTDGGTSTPMLLYRNTFIPTIQNKTEMLSAEGFY